MPQTGRDRVVGSRRVVSTVPGRLRSLEPLACLALAGHAIAVEVAVEVVAVGRWAPLVACCAAILVLLGAAGLLGARSDGAVAVRGAAILVLGFALQAVRVDTSGYFLLWFFVLVSVYPLVLPHTMSRLVAIVTPGAYLALMPLNGNDGSHGIAVLRALSLGLIGLFVHKAADAYRDALLRLGHSTAVAQEALATLQKALLPGEIGSTGWVTVAGRYQAAGVYDKIGGDWYDTIALPSGGLALVIGDVEGHDLTAASVMGLVRGAVRSYALEGHPPSIVLERVNAFLLSAGVDRLVTMAYVQLYRGDRIVTVAVAGHPVPLVAAGDGGSAGCLAAIVGPVLGIDASGRWAERTVLLPPNASLVLYTDGLVGFPEAADDQLEQFVRQVGSEAGGPVQSLANTLISGACGYDDAAVLVAQVKTVRTPPARRTFPARPISASIARTWIADLFGLWETSGALEPGACVADRLDTAQLLLTELVSNAVRHSDESVHVQLEIVDGRLRVEVGDTSERMPVMRRTEVAAAEGRGLRLVDALSSAWGVQLRPRGKVVWFEVELGAVEEGLDGGFDEEKVLAAFAEFDHSSGSA